MADILFISKAVAPPWNDSSKNLVRDLALGLQRHDAHVFGHRGDALESVRVEPIYPRGRGRFSPPMADQLRVLGRLATGRAYDLWHFFFAPNPRSSMAGRALSRVRGRPTVQTICSAPAPSARLERLLFADRNVVLSAHTESRLLDAGIARERVMRIGPSIPALSAPSESERAAFRNTLGIGQGQRLLVYPGDLEFGHGARWSIEAASTLKDVHLIVAARLKTARAREAERELRALAAERNLPCTFLGETPEIHRLLAAAEVVLLPSETLYAKMDYPLVLLEAMVLGRPIVVAKETPAEELRTGGAVVVDHGSEALAESLDTLLETDLDALGSRGRKHVLDHHNPETMAKSYERLYDSLLGG